MMKRVSHCHIVAFVLLSLVSVIVNAQVDCEVSKWSQWDQLEDDPIWEIRTRNITEFPSDGGAECPSPLEEYRRNVCRRKIELLFIIDGSGSVEDDNFDKVIKAIINFLMTLIIDENEGVRVGIIVYSSTVTADVVFLGKRGDVIRALLALSYPRGSTFTNQALDAAVIMFANHARDGSEPLVVLITDGRSSSASRTLRSARKIREAGIAVAAIGITDNIRKSEIKSIASVPELAFFAETFDVFVGLLKPLTEKICEKIKDLNVTALPPNPTEAPVVTSSCVPDIVISTVLEECPTTTIVETPPPEVVVTTVLEECDTVTVELTPTPTTKIVVSTVEPACPSPSPELIVSTVVEECETVTIESTPDPIRTTVVSTVHSVCPQPLTRTSISTSTFTEECATVTLQITPSPVTEVVVSTVPPDCPTTPPPTVPPTPVVSAADNCSCSQPYTCKASCCKLEIVFAIKRSSTFGRAAFDSAKGYITNLFQSDYFAVEVLDDLRVGFLVYSSDIEDTKNLQQYDNKQSLLDAVESITFPSSGVSSRVDLALRRASFMWHSKCSTRLIVVFTDGDEDEIAINNLPAAITDYLQGAFILAVGIKNNKGDLFPLGLEAISTQTLVLDVVEEMRKMIVAVFSSC